MNFKQGDKVRIIGISEPDSFANAKLILIGLVGIITSDVVKRDSVPYYGCNITFAHNNHEEYFYAIKLELLDE